MPSGRVRVCDLIAHDQFHRLTRNLDLRAGRLCDLFPVEIPGDRLTGHPVDAVRVEGGREIDAGVDNAADRARRRVKVPGERLVCRSRTGISTFLDIDLEI